MGNSPSSAPAQPAKQQVCVSHAAELASCNTTNASLQQQLAGLAACQSTNTSLQQQLAALEAQSLQMQQQRAGTSSSPDCEKHLKEIRDHWSKTLATDKVWKGHIGFFKSPYELATNLEHKTELDAKLTSIGGGGYYLSLAPDSLDIYLHVYESDKGVIALEIHYDPVNREWAMNVPNSGELTIQKRANSPQAVIDTINQKTEFIDHVHRIFYNPSTGKAQFFQ